MNPMRQFGANSAGAITRASWGTPGSLRNQFEGEGEASESDAYYGLPGGYVHPCCWSMPQKAGGMASRFEVLGDATLTGNLAAGINATADLTGAGDLSPAPAMQLIVSAIAAIVGTGAVSASAAGILSASASLAGSGAIAASMTALGYVVAGITGGGAVSSTMNATGSMSCDITGFTELSPQNLAAAVWNSLVANFQDAGSMGEALATAGSGGLSPTQVTMLTELYRLAGLDAAHPLVVTATTREAGASISQDIEEAPAGTVTVTRT